MKELTVKVMPGGDAFFIYSDDAPFKKAGELDMIRASNVLWNKQRQRWVIVMPDGQRMGNLEGYESRMQAIADEVRLLSIALKDGSQDEAIKLGFSRYDEIQNPPVAQGII